MKNLVEAIEKEEMKKEVPAFNGGIRETFTVRRLSFGVGVERTFPLHSPKIASITVVRKGKVRRAKLYYLRGLTGKAAKIAEVK